MTRSQDDPRRRAHARWLALAFAASATAVVPELAHQTAARPESAFVWLAPCLAGAEIWRRRGEQIAPHPLPGAALLIACLAAMVLGVVGGSPTLAWIGLSFGCVALAIFGGWPTVAATTPLLAWAPLPLALPLAFSPALEAVWAHGVTAMLNAIGLEVECVGSVIIAAHGERIEFFALDDGLVLAHGFALLGLWWCSRQGGSVMAWLIRVSGFAVAGFFLQGLVLAFAVVRLATVDPQAGRIALQRGPSLIVLAAGIALALASRRALRNGSGAQPGSGSRR